MSAEIKQTTLCYLEKDGKYLMLYRNKKKEDANEGKWIAVGGTILLVLTLPSMVINLS